MITMIILLMILIIIHIIRIMIIIMITIVIMVTHTRRLLRAGGRGPRGAQVIVLYHNISYVLYYSTQYTLKLYHVRLVYTYTYAHIYIYICI